MIIGSSTITVSGCRRRPPSPSTVVTRIVSVRRRAMPPNISVHVRARLATKLLALASRVRRRCARLTPAGMRGHHVGAPAGHPRSSGTRAPNVASMETYDNGRVFAAELFGTTVLMLGGPGVAIFAGEAVGQLGIALGFVFSLLILAYVIGPFSGAHVNPAVTLAAFLAKKITFSHAVFAWAAQLLGGALGGLIIYGIASGRDTFRRGQFAANLWSGQYYGLGATIIAEIVLTALLVIVVLSTTGPKFAVGFGGLAAGLTLALIHLISIPIDNTSVNPARS